MPQLDIDLFDDFLFFAFSAILLGFGDEESEENLIEVATDSFLAQFFIITTKKMISEKNILRRILSNIV